MCVCVCVCVHLESIGAAAAVVVHRVVGAGAIVLAGARQAGITLGLDTHIYGTCVMQTNQHMHISKKHLHLHNALHVGE